MGQPIRFRRLPTPFLLAGTIKHARPNPFEVSVADSAMPEVRVGGVGHVSLPAAPVCASYDHHYQDFRARGLSHEDADRYARAVVARDLPSTTE